MINIEYLKLLLKDNITCIVYTNETIYTSTKTGISPFMTWIDEGLDLTNSLVVDKIVGKAAAVLFVYGHVKQVYTPIISIPGLTYLQNHNIKVTYDKIIENIINRTNTGLCPMENAIINIDDVDLAYKQLKLTLNNLSGGNHE